jgi:hypothetical protein
MARHGAGATVAAFLVISVVIPALTSAFVVLVLAPLLAPLLGLR